MSVREHPAESGKKRKGQPAETPAKKTKVVDIQLSAKTAAAKKPAVKNLKTKTTAPARPAPVEPENTDVLLSEEVLQAFRKAVTLRPKKTPKISTANFLAKQPAKGKKYRIDLRVQSPGTVGYFSSGGIDPGPALRRLVRVKGLDIIGITDYHNAAYLDFVQNGAAESELSVIPCVDLCCSIGACREVFVTALFPETAGSADIFRLLEELEVPKSAYGRKDYCIEKPFGMVLSAVEGRGGLVLPSRIDKTPYRQLAIPALVEEYKIHAFDLVHLESTEYFKERWPAGQFVFFSFSNATALAQIGTRTTKLRLTSPGFAGLKEMISRRLA